MLIFFSLSACFILWLLVITKSRLTDKEMIAVIMVSAVWLLLMVSLRPMEIPDTNGYEIIFRKITNGYLQETNGIRSLLRREGYTGTEYGFVYLVKIICSYISTKPRVIFLIIAIIQLINYACFANNIYNGDKKKIISLSFFAIPYFGYMYMYVAIRGGIALSASLLAFSMTKKEKVTVLNIAEATALYLFAFSVHRMAMVFVLIEAVYFIAPRLKKESYWIIWGVLGLIVVADITPIFHLIQKFLNVVLWKSSLLASYSGYFNKAISKGPIGIRPLFFWALGVFAIYTLNESSTRNIRRYLNVYLVGLLLMALTSYIDGSFRIVDYFLFFITILLNDSASSDYVEKRYRNAASLVELAYGLMSFAIIARL